MRLDQRGQRYGAGHVIDILVGKATPRVTQLGHDALSVFGVGADLDERAWRGVVRQLLAQGLLGVDASGYQTLHLVEASRAVLSGDREVRLRTEAPRAAKAPRTKAKAAAAAADLSEQDAGVFDRLRAWRAGVAKEQGVPAYVVFHDATLRAMAQARPASLDELAGVSGVGAAKLERYGTDVLAALAG